MGVIRPGLKVDRPMGPLEEAADAIARYRSATAGALRKVKSEPSFKEMAMIPDLIQRGCVVHCVLCALKRPPPRRKKMIQSSQYAADVFGHSSRSAPFCKAKSQEVRRIL